MAGIKDILEIEQERAESKDWLNIHLFQEGSFYRAYEVSAWLCHTRINEFKVTHRHVKGIEQSIVFVGFPVSSLEKRTPEGAIIVTVAEKHLMLTLPVPETDMVVADAKNDFAVWKSRQPISSSKESADGKSNSVSRSNGGNRSLFSIAQSILAFPIESHSPIDCMLFLSELKKDLARIL